VLPFAKRPLPPAGIFAVVPTGHRFQVKQFGKRGPDDPITVISTLGLSLNQRPTKTLKASL
jgi:hypothetical protein